MCAPDDSPNPERLSISILRSCGWFRSNVTSRRFPVGVDQHLRTIGQVRFTQPVDGVRQVARHPQIVVAQVDNIAPARFSQRGVPQQLAVPRPLREIEKPDARVVPRELRGQLASRLRNPVPDDQNLKILHRLRQHAAHRVAQRFSVVVRGDQYRRFGAHSEPAGGQSGSAKAT